MTSKQLFKIARLEMDAFPGVPRGVMLAILFCFIHRVTTGNTVEESFFPRSGPTTGDDDYQI